MPIMMYRDALRRALYEEMKADPSVFVLGEDIGLYGGAYAVTKGLLEEFGPDRIRDTPMSEAAIVGAAIGAAMVGGRPVAEIMYVDFMTLTMDQVVNQAAKIHFMFGGQIKVPCVIRTQQGTGRGAGAQHSQSLESWFIHTPGLKVVAPSTPADAYGLLRASIQDDNPVIFLEHKGLYAVKDEVPEEPFVTSLGVADVRRTGSDVTLISYSRTMQLALEVAAQLEQRDISVEVVDLRTLQPLDMETVLRSVEKTRRAVVLHEAVMTGGLGAEVSARITEALFHQLLSPVRRVAAADAPLPANVALEKYVVPNAEQVIRAIEETLAVKQQIAR
ncbi:MAG: alpha-ketoacid dehydrogenase subunit beta [Anaerolineae bacterium]|nr:alpha-ketoacid dehydrogenase subunit beta [Anaerolineae bacterium]